MASSASTPTVPATMDPKLSLIFRLRSVKVGQPEAPLPDALTTGLRAVGRDESRAAADEGVVRRHRNGADEVHFLAAALTLEDDALGYHEVAL